ncbi:MAG TPA: NUDIX domain-containing protein [Clostridia bacterium]|nr:NUDIX domain-containing protein [Clostridia bacterium]
MSELWDLYDRDRSKTGRTHERSLHLPEGTYHIVVHVWMRNKQGEWLISKRTPNKDFPNMWETTGGSALAGENSLEAAVREAHEELGVTLDPQKGVLFRTDRRDRFDYPSCPDFRDVWVFPLEWPIETITLQENETCDAKWATNKEIYAMMERGAFIGNRIYGYLDELFAKSA